MKKSLCYLNNLIFIFFSSFILLCISLINRTDLSYLELFFLIVISFNSFVIVLEFIMKEKILKDNNYNYMVLLFNVLVILENIIFIKMSKFMIVSFSSTIMMILYFLIILYNYLKLEKFGNLFYIKKNKPIKNLLYILLLFVLSIFITYLIIKSPYFPISINFKRLW